MQVPMNSCPPTHPVRHASEKFDPFAEKLKTIYSAMDLAYAEVADGCGFLCAGCEDNCCRTRFYHHTYLEWLYLLRGWKKLEARQQAAIHSRAEDVCRQMAAAEPERGIPRRMCPLNSDGLCELYEFRPMICRLHGIPHTLHRPDGRKVIGPGCDDFHRQCASRSDTALDRTPHYRALADLEQQTRRALGLTDKIKLTVADMIVQFTYKDITI